MVKSPFMIAHDQPVALFIDGPALREMQHGLNLDIDFKKLLEHFKTNCPLYRAYFFSPIAEQDDNPQIKKLFDFVSYNGYRGIKKAVAVYNDADGRRKIRSDLRVEITTEMLESTPFAQHLVLITNNSDYAYAVEAVQRHGCKVTVVWAKGFSENNSDALHRQCDNFVDLADAKDVLRKQPLVVASAQSHQPGGPAPAGLTNKSDLVATGIPAVPTPPVTPPPPPPPGYPLYAPPPKPPTEPVRINRPAETGTAARATLRMTKSPAKSEQGLETKPQVRQPADPVALTDAEADPNEFVNDAINSGRRNRSLAHTSQGDGQRRYARSEERPLFDLTQESVGV